MGREDASKAWGSKEGTHSPPHGLLALQRMSQGWGHAGGGRGAQAATGDASVTWAGPSHTD